MSDIKDDLELTLDDDKKPGNLDDVVVEHDEKSAAKAEKEEKPQKSADEVAAELKRQLDESEKKRLDAERRANQAESTAQKSLSEVQETNIRLIDSAIGTKKNERAAIKKQYSEAIASGEYELAADLNDKLADVVVDLKKLEEGREALKIAPQPTQKRSAVDDFIEGVRSSGSPRSAEWLKARPQYITDARLHQKMIAAHNIAMADGIAPDTDEYFAAVEAVLGIKPQEDRRAAAQADDEGDDASAAAAKVVGGRQARESAPPPAAPPSRQSPSNGGSRPNVVRLTAEEREMASMMGMTEKEYAQNKLALKREGKIH